jgi:hypothetical protein
MEIVFSQADFYPRNILVNEKLLVTAMWTGKLLAGIPSGNTARHIWLSIEAKIGAFNLFNILPPQYDRDLNITGSLLLCPMYPSHVAARRLSRSLSR